MTLMNGKNWAEIHRRMEAVEAVLTERISPPPKKMRAILKERARALSCETTNQTAEEATIEIVEFLLADEHYGIESASVRYVYPLKDLTPLPGVPPFVLGVINLHGQILSVIDLKKFFDLPTKELVDLNRVIALCSDQPPLAQGKGMEFGILTNQILGVRTIPIREIQPPLPTLTGIREEYLRGVTKESLVVLDAQKLLRNEKFVVNESVE